MDILGGTADWNGNEGYNCKIYNVLIYMKTMLKNMILKHFSAYI